MGVGVYLKRRFGVRMAGILPPGYGHRMSRVEVVAMIQPKRFFRGWAELSRFAIVAFLLSAPVMAQASQGPIKPGQQAPPTQVTPPAQATSPTQPPPPAQSAP